MARTESGLLSMSVNDSVRAALRGACRVHEKSATGRLPETLEQLYTPRTYIIADNKCAQLRAATIKSKL